MNRNGKTEIKADPAEYLVGDDASLTTVLVAFQVFGTPEQAEKLIESRLDRVKLMSYNDSSDFTSGTADPLNTYAVLPVARLLEEAL